MKKTDQQLHSILKQKVQLERKTLAEILDLLKEVWERKSFAKMGYSRLTDFMVKELGYSESAAYRRYAALKLCEQVPKAKELIKSGEMSLSNASKVSSMMKGSTATEKAQAVDKIKGKTTLEAERTILDMTGASTTKKDSQKSETATTTRISTSIDNTTLDKLEKFKARTKRYTTAAALDLALDLALKQLETKRKYTSKGSSNPRTIPAKTKRDVLKRANHRCQYPGCKEQHYLEIDHIHPVSRGGGNQLQNLQVLCRVHNQFKGA